MRDVHRRRAVRKIASWIFGFIASMIVGGMFGAWLLTSWLVGGVWGVLAGAFTFACFRPWPTNMQNSDAGEGPKITWQGVDRSPQKNSPDEFAK
jgi:hypothetical protein